MNQAFDLARVEVAFKGKVVSDMFPSWQALHGRLVALPRRQAPRGWREVSVMVRALGWGCF